MKHEREILSKELHWFSCQSSPWSLSVFPRKSKAKWDNREEKLYEGSTAGDWELFPLHPLYRKTGQFWGILWEVPTRLLYGPERVLTEMLLYSWLNIQRSDVRYFRNVLNWETGKNWNYNERNETVFVWNCSSWSVLALALKCFKRRIGSYWAL